MRTIFKVSLSNSSPISSANQSCLFHYPTLFLTQNAIQNGGGVAENDAGAAGDAAAPAGGANEADGVAQPPQQQQPHRHHHHPLDVDMDRVFGGEEDDDDEEEDEDEEEDFEADDEEEENDGEGGEDGAVQVAVVDILLKSRLLLRIPVFLSATVLTPSGL